MRKLLVPVDGSDNALRALRYAISLARKNGPIEIHVVTAHDDPDIHGEIAVYVTSEKMADLQRQIAEARLAPAVQLLEEAAVPYVKEILIGSTAEVIARRADELGCDGIVMGKSRSSSSVIASPLVGSVRRPAAFRCCRRRGAAPEPRLTSR